MKTTAKFALVSIVLATTAGAQAQTGGGQITLGASIGYLYPQSAALKAAFGDTVVHVGITPVNSGSRQDGISPSWEVISASKNGSHMLLIPVTYGIERSIGGSSVRPYYRVFAGYSYMDYNISGTSSRGFTPTWGAEVGLTLAKNARVSARYNGFKSRSGINFNNLEVNATYSLFKF